MKYLLGKRLNIDPQSVHAVIVGEHGDSELAVWSGANIADVDLRHFCALRGIQDPDAMKAEVYDEVRNSAYKIIDRKGATYFGIAATVTRIARCIVRDEHSILPVSAPLDGLYGIDDLYMSVPTVLGMSGAEQVLEIPLSSEEREAFYASAATLREVANSLEL